MVKRSEPTARVFLDLVTSRFDKSLQKSTQTFKRSATELNSKLELLSKAFTAVIGLGGGMASSLKELSSLASEQERVERRLISALQQRGEFTRDNFEELQKFNSALQQQLGIGDEILLQAQGTFAAMGLNKTQMQDATKAAIGLSEATGQSLTEASRIVSKALQGNVGILKEYAINVSDTAEAQEKLNQLFQVAAAQSGSLATKAKVLDANWGDFKETLGAAVNRSGTLSSAMDILNKVVISLINSFGGSQGAAALNSFFGTIASGVATAIRGFVKFSEVWGKVVDTALAYRLTLEGGIGNNFFGRLQQNVNRLQGNTESANAATDSLVSTLERLASGLDAASGAGLINFKSALEDIKVTAIETGEEVRKATSAFSGTGDDGAVLSTETSVSGAQQGAALPPEMQARIDMWHNFGDASRMAITDSFSSQISALASGEASVGDALKGFAAGTLKIIGQYLIQLGTAAVVAGTLGSIVPFLAPATGGPLGVGAGLAAIAAGTALVAGGALLGGRTGGGASSFSPSRAISRGSATRATAAAGGTPAFGSLGLGLGESAGQTVVVNFNGPVGGSPRRIGRDLQNILNKSKTLEIGAAG